MRTTVSIRDDLALELERIRKERDVSFKQVLNEAVERGVVEMRQKPKEQRRPFRIRTFDLGKPLFNGPEELKELIADIQEEEDLHKIGLK
jgi:predicted CopG family antitoxin